jgi:hypothetical protein
MRKLSAEDLSGLEAADLESEFAGEIAKLSEGGIRTVSRCPKCGQVSLWEATNVQVSAQCSGCQEVFNVEFGEIEFKQIEASVLGQQGGQESVCASIGNEMATDICAVMPDS